MREPPRQQGVCELRLAVPDPRLKAVKARVAAEIASLDPREEAEALSFIEAVSEFDARDTK